MFVLLRNFVVIISADYNSCGNATNNNLPLDWPRCWSEGIVPFVFDFYSLSPRRLVNLVLKGHNYLQDRSCLVFKEHNPVTSALIQNFTYLYYTYSGVLERCSEFYTQPFGRRVVLITPLCTLPSEVAHVILHALGLVHRKKEAFSVSKAKAVLFPNKCKDFDQKLKNFESKL